VLSDNGPTRGFFITWYIGWHTWKNDKEDYLGSSQEPDGIISVQRHTWKESWIIVFPYPGTHEAHGQGGTGFSYCRPCGRVGIGAKG